MEASRTAIETEIQGEVDKGDPTRREVGVDRQGPVRSHSICSFL